MTPPLTPARIAALEAMIRDNPDDAAGYLMQEAPALLEAARRDADVRTLDAFNPNWRMALAPDGGSYCLPRGGDALAFDGSTPAEARSKAAAWVREQSATPPGESK